MNPKSKDLIARLRIVAGQSVVKPPAIDIEAADYIEQLEKELARARRRLPNLLPGQLEKDVPWRNVQPDAFCFILGETTVFDGKEVLRTWNAMRDALLKRHDAECAHVGHLSQEHLDSIEEAAHVLESAAAHNLSKCRTVLANTQQDRADRLRCALAAANTQIRY
ncbi:hypothetical protein [Duganella sp. FT27W]|uniref:hypothetical protein n=1 Tax=Duganella sp. FT27W TaxID=2654636 RepID=UPI00128C0075|nr:hypothetical protein [Duganella sp. FT27W]MPQ56381.1 hypothetical protein [Duganella sp. FT27W]